MSKVKYQLPYRFEYVVNWSGKTYTAIKNATGLYDCYEQSSSNKHLGFTATDQSVTTFEAAVEAGAIKIITENCPVLIDETPQRYISINVNSVHYAAKWEVENNPYAKQRGDNIHLVSDEINDLVMRIYNSVMAGECEWEYRSISTGSYTVQFQPEDDSYGIISVLIDPAVGQHSYYVDVAEYLNQI